MGNPFNPLDWARAAQDWFHKTERSSGFRPFLIFLVLLFGFSVTVLAFFPEHPISKNVLPYLLVISCAAFLLLYFLKAFQDPNFCRSEKHVENVKRIELMEQKGDSGPRVIEGTAAEVEVPKELPGPGREAGNG